MHWTSSTQSHFWILIISLICISEAVGKNSQETTNMPPTISSVETKVVVKGEWAKLEDPQDYVLFPSTINTDAHVNRLQCTVTNANNIKWQFVSDESMKASKKEGNEPDWKDTFNDDPNLGMLQPAATRTGTTLTREINDRKFGFIRDIKTISGFYRCVASNDYNFTAVSGTVQLIVPSLSASDGDLLNPATLDTNMVATEKESLGPLPCLRETALSDRQPFVSRVTPDDFNKYNPNFVQYSWKRYDQDGQDVLYTDKSDNRLQINPNTGDLYFLYLNSTADSTGSLKCFVKVGPGIEKPTNEIGAFTINANPNPAPLTELIYPVSGGTDPHFTCIGGKDCKLICIFSGIKAVEGQVRFWKPDDTTIPVSKADDKDNFVTITPPKIHNTIKYACELYDPSSSPQVIRREEIRVKVISYFEIVESDGFGLTAPRYKFSNQDISFICNTQLSKRIEQNTKFYINGQHLTKSNMANYNIIYDDETSPNSFKVPNAKSDGSLSAQCTVSNEAGTTSSTTTLIIFDEPVLKAEPKSIQVIDEKTTKNSSSTGDAALSFKCSVTLDLKIDSASIVWFSNRTGTDKDKPITEGDKFGVKNVVSPIYKPGRKFYSTLTIENLPDTVNKLKNTGWECKLTYTVDGHSGSPVEPIIMKMSFGYANPPAAVVPTPPPWPHLPVVLGAVGGFLFLILLIVLINCFVQKNKGEQYYVDDQERKAGHNPQEELKEYEFADYNRPDQNPIKGSRASMNFSDKPMESDTGSLDEYGDINLGRYNEDGSFIDQYGQGGAGGHSSRHQADV